MSRGAQGEAFVAFALAERALRLGEFTLKSGRRSPYFFDSGAFSSGRALARLGAFYADALVESGLEFEVLFGPAYKGIPLAVATAMALADHHGRDTGVAYNRKEAKAHGEGGRVVGAPLDARVVVLDDVLTAGTAVREVLPVLEAAGARVTGVMIALDRQERAAGGGSAVQELEASLGVPVRSIAGLDDVIEHLRASADAGTLAAMEAYRRRYGVETTHGSSGR